MKPPWDRGGIKCILMVRKYSELELKRLQGSRALMKKRGWHEQVPPPSLSLLAFSWIPSQVPLGGAPSRSHQPSSQPYVSIFFQVLPHKRLCSHTYPVLEGSSRPVKAMKQCFPLSSHHSVLLPVLIFTSSWPFPSHYHISGPLFFAFPCWCTMLGGYHCQKIDPNK